MVCIPKTGPQLLVQKAVTNSSDNTHKKLPTGNIARANPSPVATKLLYVILKYVQKKDM